VALRGTGAQMSRAFGVELHMYQTATHAYRGHECPAHVPVKLAKVVERVHGLENRQVVQPHVRALAGPTGVGAPASATPLMPPQVARLYDFPTTSAAGQTIGIIELGRGFKPADIQAHFNNIVHLRVPKVTSVGVDDAANTPGGSADLEVTLGIDVAGSVAPGANIVVYFASNTVQGTIDVLATAIHDTTHKPSVLSISWRANESGWDSSISGISSAIQEAAALGVTVLLSSGDSGSENPAQVEYFVSDPGVTARGGTTVENVIGTAVTRVAWGGSGGVSNRFALPYWQGRAGVPTSVDPRGQVGRGVPDIAGNADPNSGYMLIRNGAQVGPVSGTNVVAPSYAALVALLDAGLGEPLGYLNYNLHAFAGAAAYRDISAGNSGLDAAKPGWDACTGFASVDGSAMLEALWGVGLPPALATVGRSLPMTWKGMLRDERTFHSTFNGSAWAPQELVAGIAIGSATARAEFNGKTYMAWKGLYGDRRIHWSTFNGATWTQQQVAVAGTRTGPRLAAYNGKLYVAWKGVEGDQWPFWSAFNGSSWSAQQQVPRAASNVGPALATFGNPLHAAWRGMYGDPCTYCSTFNGTGWAPPRQIAGVGTSEGRSPAVFAGQLYAACRGMLWDERLWWSRFSASR
jgi:kumamolisin